VTEKLIKFNTLVEKYQIRSL